MQRATQSSQENPIARGLLPLLGQRNGLKEESGSSETYQPEIMNGLMNKLKLSFCFLLTTLFTFNNFIVLFSYCKLRMMKNSCAKSNNCEKLYDHFKKSLKV